MQNSHKGSFLLLIILTAIVVRVPFIILMKNAIIPGDDASLYLQCAKNLGDGKGYYVNYRKYSFKSKNLLIKYIEKYGVKDYLDWIPPLYVAVLAGIYKIFNPSNFIFSVVLFNILLFLITIVIIYYEFNKLNIINSNIIFLSFILIVINPILVWYSVDTIMEMLFLLFSILAFFKHIELIRKEQLTFKDYIIYSLYLSLVFLTKYAGGVIILAFLSHFLLRKRIKDTIILSFIIFILTTPWYIFRSYYFCRTTSGIIFPTLRLTCSWPFDAVKLRLLSIGIISRLHHYLGFLKIIFRRLNQNFINYLSVDEFFFLFPFILIYLFIKRKRIYFQSSLILLVFVIIFFSFYSAQTPRYYLYLIPILLPIGLSGFIEYLRQCQLLKSVYFYILMALLISMPLYKVLDDYTLRRRHILNQNEVGNAVIKIDQSIIKNDSSVIATDMAFVNYLTNNPTVALPWNLTSQSVEKFISFYKIDYILVSKLASIGYPIAWVGYSENGVVEKLRNGNYNSENMNLVQNVNVKIGKVKLYRVKK